jgi:inner membrane protein involved in colicin E2 resistance
MELIKLIAGLSLLGIFGWLLLRNAEKKGFINSWLRLETVTGILVGLYLIITSVVSLLG